MDITVLSQAIGTIGFPITCCLLSFWFINKLMEKYTSVIERNTQALILISERLGVDNEILHGGQDTKQE